MVDEPGITKEAATTMNSADIGPESCENSEIFNSFIEKAKAFDHRTGGDLHGPISGLIGKVKHRKKLAREQRDGTSGRHYPFREEARSSSPSTSTGPKRYPGLRGLRGKASRREKTPETRESLQDLAHGGDARTSVQSNISHKKNRWQDRETMDSQSPEAAHLSQPKDNLSLDPLLSHHDHRLTTTEGSNLSSQFRPRQAPQLSAVLRRNFKTAPTSNVGRSADQGARVCAASRMRITSDEFRRQAFMPPIENVLPQLFSPKVFHIKGITAFWSTNPDEFTRLSRDDDEEKKIIEAAGHIKDGPSMTEFLSNSTQGP